MDLENINSNENKASISRTLILVMSLASGITVANIYYLQPLMAHLALFFHITKAQAGLIATLVQVGYACGLLIILPMADIVNKRKLISIMLVLSGLCLFLFYLSTHVFLASLAAFGIGFTSIIPPLLIPLGAQMAKPDERGKVIGSIMSGMLVGILLSRVLSGIIGNYWGWKSIYLLAMFCMFVLAIVLHNLLPRCDRCCEISYIESIKSLKTLFLQYYPLRECAVIGALAFCSFHAFWTSLTFFLQGSPYYMGSDVAGLFGLVGVIGAIISPIAGKVTDLKGSRYTVKVTIVIVFISFIVFLFFGFQMWGLIIGVILLDFGVQCCNVSNQAAINRLNDEARNRITAIYLVSFFLGGAFGSYFGALIFQHFNWLGVCVFGLVTQGVALSIHYRGKTYISSAPK
jgi:predicted MFS family arabinose efflux permease